jgi:hypothetical protein
VVTRSRRSNGSFYIALTKDTKFIGDASGSLVLSEDQKELILSFAESQAMNQTGFDDIISGKGRGDITLLSGPPGVGKVGLSHSDPSSTCSKPIR